MASSSAVATGASGIVSTRSACRWCTPTTIKLYLSKAIRWKVRIFEMADRAALVGYCGSGIAKQRSGRSFEVSFMLRYMQRMVATAVSNGLEHVRIEIARACRDANRNPAEVTLVAVSKTFSTDAIEPVIAAGQRVFGENRVQEAKTKWPPLLEKHAGIELHLIGPLQSNKAKEAVALFDAIHSVDRASLCEALAKEIGKQQHHPILFVEINTGAEPQKAGVLPQDADTFLVACHEKYRLKISGLMCIPPLDEAPGPHFALTAKIAKRNGLNLLSMGMSADFATAIALGATHVRVGSAIFGGRSK